MSGWAGTRWHGVSDRYPSDLTDEQWALIEPLLPPPRTGPAGGRREKHPRRQVVNAILYVVRTGCAWRQLPREFPPWETVYWYFARWHDDGTVMRVHDALRDQVRVAEGRDVRPSAGIIDSQSVKGADTVGKPTRGFDAGKKTNGRKRFIVTDTIGILLIVWVMAASVQDRKGGRRVLNRLHDDYPSVKTIWADGGFSGFLVDWATRILRRNVLIVRKRPDQHGFEVLPRRWAVERTLAWISSHRRLAKDYERDPAISETMIRWAMIGLMTRRLTRGRPATRPGPRPLRRVTP